MAEDEIYKNTASRLEKYHLFSEATIKKVAEFAQKQTAYKTYQELFKDIGIPKPKLHVGPQGSGVPVVDIAAKSSKAKGILVMHLPMGNPLDSNQLYQIATAAGVNPDFRIIAFGNPSGGANNFKQQNLRFWQRMAIALSKNPRALVMAEQDYLKSQNISEVYQAGYSYGALKAVIESFYAEDIKLKGLIIIDPVAHPRGIKQLIHDFRATFKPLGNYVNHSKIPSFFQARKDAEGSVSTKSLFRGINIAIAIMLSRTDFISLLEKVLRKYPDVPTRVAWASKSELGNDAHMKVSLHRFIHEYKFKNIQPMRLIDDTHAVANDIHLHAAIIREALV